MAPLILSASMPTAAVLFATKQRSTVRAKSIRPRAAVSAAPSEECSYEGFALCKTLPDSQQAEV